LARLLREPLLHFLAVGLVLFFAADPAGARDLVADLV